MSSVDPGEGYRLLIEGELIPKNATYLAIGLWHELQTDCSGGERWTKEIYFPMRVPIESINNTGAEVTTSGPYVAIEVHRAALKEIDRLQWELRDSKVWWKKEIERLKAELDAVKQPQPNPSSAPQSGQYWIHDKDGDKAYFIGKCPDDIMVWQIEGDDIEHGNLDWSGWHHEPRCTGWDWQPEPEPEWFDLTPFGEHVLRRDVDWVVYTDSERWQIAGISRGAKIGQVRGYIARARCLLKDAPPELVAMASKPAEDPDEWVTQDRCHVRKLVDQFRWITAIQGRAEEWLTSYVDEPERYHGWIHQDSGKRLELRCRRRDLPPMPEQKPKTEREVLLYWYDGSVVGRYANCPPTDPSFVPLIVRDEKVFIETETREVNRG